MQIRDVLRKSRLDKNMTMLDVAKSVGVSEATISRWESGNITNMKRDNVAKLSETLNIPIRVLMGWDEDDATAAFPPEWRVYTSSSDRLAGDMAGLLRVLAARADEQRPANHRIFRL